MGELAGRHGLKLHIDGARIFNAAVALGVDASRLAAAADSVTFCLSKGLAAPVGSVVCGSEAFIARARRVRKSLGGGMRQAGIIAAAGLVALDEMVDRLAEDHANARALAEGLSQIQGLGVDPQAVATNIVYFEVEKKKMAAPDLAVALQAEGVRVLPTAPNRLRAVLHYHIGRDQVRRALAIFGRVMTSRGR